MATAVGGKTTSRSWTVEVTVCMSSHPLLFALHVTVVTISVGRNFISWVVNNSHTDWNQTLIPPHLQWPGLSSCIRSSVIASIHASMHPKSFLIRPFVWLTVSVFVCLYDNLSVVLFVCLTWSRYDRLPGSGEAHLPVASRRVLSWVLLGQPEDVGRGGRGIRVEAICYRLVSHRDGRCSNTLDLFRLEKKDVTCHIEITCSYLWKNKLSYFRPLK